MTGQIQADVEQLRHVAQAMRDFNAVLHNNHRGIMGKAQSFVTDVFRGDLQALFETAITTFDPRVYALSGISDDWATRLEALATKLEAADIAISYDLPPRNMAELYQHIDELYKGNTPIKIVQTADGEYLVMLAGTNPPLDQIKSYQQFWSQSNNPLAAILANLGQDNEYYHDIMQAIHKQVPRGSKINFAGHSLGGIEAHLFAGDRTFNQDYTIKSISTFGTPEPGIRNRRNDIQYNLYAGGDDNVPRASPKHIISNILNLKNLLTADPQGQTILEKGLEHSDYEKSKKLRQIPVTFPINSQKWLETGQNHTANADEIDDVAVNILGKVVADKIPRL